MESRLYCGDSVQIVDCPKVVVYKIYPNPTTDSFSFDGCERVTVYDVLGRKVGVFRHQDIGVQAWGQGVYWVENERRQVLKLIVN